MFVADASTVSSAPAMISPYVELLTQLCLAIVGGLIGFAAAFFTSKLKEGREDRFIYLAKMERAYMLRQKLYDGHKREVSRLSRDNRNTTTHEWLKERAHPGEEMAELRMLVALYAPHIDDALQRCGRDHEALKKLFRDVDRAVEKGDVAILEDKSRKNEADKLLKELSNSTRELSRRIVESIPQKA